MTRLAPLLLLAPLVLALQIGQLQFTDVNSAQDLASALRDGPLLIFIHQPDCPGCQYLKTQVFTQPQVASALSGVNLISIDLAKYLIRGLEVVADGQVYIYSEGSLRVAKASGRQNVPVIGTPTVVMGYVKNGEIHVTLIMVGAAPPDVFLQLVKTAYANVQTQQTPQPANTPPPTPEKGAAQMTQPTPSAEASPLTPGAYLQLLVSFAAGAASVFSPCVLPVLTIAATTYLARRSLALVLAGMTLSFAAIATVVTAAATWAGSVVNTVLYAVGGAALIAMGAVLVVERLNNAFMVWASRFQTSAYKASKLQLGKLSDVALGLSLGAVWTPCIAPLFGAVVVANLVASAVTGNYIALFASTLAYAAGLAAVVYALINVARRGALKASRSMKWSMWGRRVEYIVGILSIAFGILLIGEALGLGTFSALFKL
ncbi:cytochrome c biogenesis protein [Pyrobaculum ferrireducens]|uniref:Cytochrome c biogenesis protein n=1 Tax=Pyrobaculum ferrireducens TaxID=1104324 RepID=G7VFK6_9CREN|nr:cytochrome c biogenesis protein [Pyrobaculum ferrireducens]AET34212.1 cytochrome c biogenesis protein [Pyrobaculum ferrireducens]